MIDPKDCTIIIPHLGATAEERYALQQCVESLKKTSKSRILIACNGNQGQGGQIWIAEQGQCKAVNAAAAIVDTPWIFVTNDDMIYAPEWWIALTFSITEEMRCVSPQLVEPRPGAPTFQVQPFGGAGGDFNKEKWLEYARNWRVKSPDNIRPGFNLPFLITKELWDLVGGYDVNYDPWGSNGDSDLEYKIKLAGVQPYQNINCLVYHFSQTSGTFHPENDSYRFRNYAYFKKKWGFDRTDDGIWEATFNIPSINEGRVFAPHWEGHYQPKPNYMRGMQVGQTYGE